VHSVPDAHQPGPIKKPLVDLQPRKTIFARMLTTIPMGEHGRTGRVARQGVSWLQDDSSFVQPGIELFVDEGRSYDREVVLGRVTREKRNASSNSGSQRLSQRCVGRFLFSPTRCGRVGSI